MAQASLVPLPQSLTMRLKGLTSSHCKNWTWFVLNKTRSVLWRLVICTVVFWLVLQIQLIKVVMLFVQVSRWCVALFRVRFGVSCGGRGRQYPCRYCLWFSIFCQYAFHCAYLGISWSIPRGCQWCLFGHWNLQPHDSIVVDNLLNSGAVVVPWGQPSCKWSPWTS